ncbi:MAG: HlyD family efflux transporter periplasmic adaptor subunit [Phycisphaerales bacterium]|nr:HlyD family efflux transporter periplasmic adaptor subunit [Phycisphaerales bacterium]
MNAATLWSALVILASASAFADDSPTAAVVKPQPTLATVEKGELTLTVDQAGRIGSTRKTIIRFEPEAFDGQVTVVKVVAKPGIVRAGDVIAQLKGKDFDKKLADLKTQLAEATDRLAAQVEEQIVTRLDEATTLERSERAATLAAQRLKLRREYYDTRDLELEALRTKGQVDNLKEQGEELSQLERMYNDATLETETKDIVLGRAKRAFDRSQIHNRYAIKDHDFFLAIDHPNSVREIEDNTRYAQQSLDHLRIRQRLQSMQMRLALAGAERSLEELKLRLARFESDGANFTVKAPVDGVIVIALPEVGEPVGEPVGARMVMATIVDPSTLEVTGSFDLDALRIIEVGSVVAAWIPNRPESTGTVVVDEISPIGTAAGTGATFAYTASVRTCDGAWPIGAEAHLVARKAIADCILVDSKAIKAEKGKWTVNLWIDGKKVERDIRIGASDGTKTQVISGLCVGDQAVLGDG